MKNAIKNAAGIARKITVAIRDACLFTHGASRIGAMVFAAVMCFGLAACGGGGGGSSSAAPTAQPTPNLPPQGDVRVRYNLPGIADGLTQTVPANIANSPTRASYSFPLTIDGVVYTVELTMQNGQIVSADARRTIPVVVIDPNGTSGGISNRLIPDAGTGTKDPVYTSGCITGGADGQCFVDSHGHVAALESAVYRKYPDGAQFGHRRIQNSADNTVLDVLLPPQDVRAAWRAGWTGRDVNILVIGHFGRKYSVNNPAIGYGIDQGFAVTMAAKQIAGRAQFYFLERGGILGLPYGAFGDNDDEPLRVRRETPIQVITFGAGGVLRDDRYRPRAPTEAEVRNFRNSNSLWRQIYSDVRPVPVCVPTLEESCSGVVGGYGLEKTEDAVIVASAGHGVADANWGLMNNALLSDEQLVPRVLMVGGVTHFPRASTANEPAQVSTTATFYDSGFGNSNFAGSDREMQERFLVEYDGLAWAHNSIQNIWGHFCLNDDTPNTCDFQQTSDFPFGFASFAAARVAGYAALVRQKFPTISGAQTAKILLDTATYEGLSHAGRRCSDTLGGCPVHLYGQGRVDIGAALSPVGRLE